MIATSARRQQRDMWGAGVGAMVATKARTPTGLELCQLNIEGSLAGLLHCMFALILVTPKDQQWQSPLFRISSF